MVFCLIMSLLVGLIHGILQSKLRLYEGGGGLVNFSLIQNNLTLVIFTLA